MAYPRAFGAGSGGRLRRGQLLPVGRAADGAGIRPDRLSGRLHLGCEKAEPWPEGRAEVAGAAAGGGGLLGGAADLCAHHQLLAALYRGFGHRDFLLSPE